MSEEQTHQLRNERQMSQEPVKAAPLTSLWNREHAAMQPIAGEVTAHVDKGCDSPDTVDEKEDGRRIPELAPAICLSRQGGSGNPKSDPPGVSTGSPDDPVDEGDVGIADPSKRPSLKRPSARPVMLTKQQKKPTKGQQQNTELKSG